MAEVMGSNLQYLQLLMLQLQLRLSFSCSRARIWSLIDCRARLSPPPHRLKSRKQRRPSPRWWRVPTWGPPDRGSFSPHKYCRGRGRSSFSPCPEAWSLTRNPEFYWPTQGVSYPGRSWDSAFNILIPNTPNWWRSTTTQQQEHIFSYIYRS